MNTAFNKQVRTLWRVTFRKLSVVPSERTTFVWHVAIDSKSEHEAVKAVQLRFSSEWWSNRIIIEVTEIGELHVLDDIALEYLD